ncbi:COX15/CtaA family protein [Flavobacteriales bacterium]|jgi:cytochrome c oxidase assembly protein subunit 15|nr:COX15/CtaA family protein [Flavobacteriales bacterium]
MKGLKNISWIVLINIFLVIIAGSIVRMTGSGMGCPDWPKCFGHLIPPTMESELAYSAGKEFSKGQMVIEEEALWVANEKFVASESFDLKDWTKYTKHSYAKFNALHTWIEYINRLFGALLGFFALIMIVLAARKRKVNSWLLILSILQLFFILFQAWLGKLTVDTNLNPYMITYHMMGVTVMIIIQLALLSHIYREINGADSKIKTSFLTKIVSVGAIVLMFVQIVLGTQVRQQTDVMFKSGTPRELIPKGFDWVFFVHRSFSLLIVFSLAYLFFKLKSVSEFKRPLGYLISFTLTEILFGIILYYFEMPAFAQPTHLLLSLLLYAFFVEIYLRQLPKTSYLNSN